MKTKEGIDPFFTRDSLRSTSGMYLAGQDPRQPLLSPAVCADMTGFPPLLLQVGTNEVLLDDSTRLAERARDGGVDVALDVTADVQGADFASNLDAAASWTRSTTGASAPADASFIAAPGILRTALVGG